jgi:hypothetical protein
MRVDQPRLRSLAVALALALGACGCSLIGLAGGAGVDAIKGRHADRLTADELPALKNGTSVTLLMADSSALVGRKIAAQAADSSGDTLLGLRLLLPPVGDSWVGDTTVVPLAQILEGTAPHQGHAAQKALKAGAKGDLVVLEVAAAIAVAAVLIGLLFAAILSGSGFSF